MKTVIVILILLAFLQISVVPVNLALTLILVRSFVRQDKTNFYLAFGIGLLLSLLQQLPLGILSLTFCLMVEVIYLWRRTAFSESIWTILPLVGISLLVTDLVTVYTISWTRILMEIGLILPMYLAVRFWEERFIVHPEKLRI